MMMMMMMMMMMTTSWDYLFFDFWLISNQRCWYVLDYFFAAPIEFFFFFFKAGLRGGRASPAVWTHHHTSGCLPHHCNQSICGWLIPSVQSAAERAVRLEEGGGWLSFRGLGSHWQQPHNSIPIFISGVGYVSQKAWSGARACFYARARHSSVY